MPENIEFQLIKAFFTQKCVHHIFKSRKMLEKYSKYSKIRQIESQLVGDKLAY